MVVLCLSRVLIRRGLLVRCLGRRRRVGRWYDCFVVVGVGFCYGGGVGLAVGCGMCDLGMAGLPDLCSLGGCVGAFDALGWSLWLICVLWLVG